MTVNDIENIVQILFPDNSILYREEKILSLNNADNGWTLGYFAKIRIIRSIGDD